MRSALWSSTVMRARVKPVPVSIPPSLESPILQEMIWAPAHAYRHTTLLALSLLPSLQTKDCRRDSCLLACSWWQTRQNRTKASQCFFWIANAVAQACNLLHSSFACALDQSREADGRSDLISEAERLLRCCLCKVEGTSESHYKHQQAVWMCTLCRTGSFCTSP